jgi:predicted MFS family arabinose efflux permease
VIRLPRLLEPMISKLGNRFGWNRNFTLGVLNGWFVFAGDGFMNASIVLSSFAAALGASNTVIGLLPAIQTGGWMLPQILVASRVRHVPRKITVYRGASGIRFASQLAIVLATLLFPNNPGLLLGTFLVALTASAIASGVSGLPWLEVAAKIIPGDRRPAFFATRNLYGGLLALVAGVAVRALLGSSLVFPYDYAIIFSFGTLAYSAGWWLYGFVDEPPDDPPQPRARILEELRAIPQTVTKNPDFAAFVLLRVTVAVASLSDPFFTVFALRQIGVSKAEVGTFVIVLGIIGPLSNAAWQRLATRFGSRRTIRYSLAFSILAPLTAILMPQGAGMWFAVVFAFSGIANAGLNIANPNYLLGVAPSEARGRYIGTINTMVGVALFMSVPAGRLVDTLGYQPVFALGAGLYALAWFLAGRLKPGV